MADLMVACPTCQKKCKYDVTNAFRPFCSERCKISDIAAWANESYRVPVTESDNSASLEEEDS